MRRSTLILAGLLVSGCGDQESSPVPQPVPGLIRQSTPKTQTERLLAGLPGSVAGQGKVHLEDGVTKKVVVVPSTAEGSFVAVLLATEATSLEARYENTDGLSEPVPLNTRSLGLTPVLGQPTYQGVITTPHGGEVVVSNDGGAGQPPLFDATPEVDVVVANTTNGAVATSKTDKNGVFTAKIAAASGDLIQIMLVDPTAADLTSEFLTFKVP